MKIKALLFILLLSLCGLSTLYVIKKNPKQTLKYYIKAAEQGDYNAELHLGYMYYKGEGTRKNVSQALIWIDKAAEHGLPEAQAFLGRLYYTGGQGRLKNPYMAFKWFRLAAKQGYAEGQWGLGRILYDRYLDGIMPVLTKYPFFDERGHVKAITKQERLKLNESLNDVKKSFVWTKKAAEQGHSEAQLLLAQMYHNGDGINKDLHKSAYWCHLSFEGGSKEAEILWNKWELWKYSTLRST